MNRALPRRSYLSLCIFEGGLWGEARHNKVGCRAHFTRTKMNRNKYGGRRWSKIPHQFAEGQAPVSEYQTPQRQFLLETTKVALLSWGKRQANRETEDISRIDQSVGVPEAATARPICTTPRMRKKIRCSVSSTTISPLGLIDRTTRIKSPRWSRAGEGTTRQRHEDSRIAPSYATCHTKSTGSLECGTKVPDTERANHA